MHTRLGQSRPRALRLVTVALAMSARPVTRAWLSDALRFYQQANPETGRMQFERDKRDLAAAGVPIVEEDDTYRIAGGRTPTFSDAELDALTTISGLVADPETGAALAAFAGPAEAYPDVTHDDRVLSSVPEAPALADAIADGRAVTFDYRPANGPTATRTLEPWGLRTRRGLWYVVGHDRDRDHHRHFRLDRIEGGVRDTGAASAARPEELPTDLLPPDAGPVLVHLLDRGHFEAHRLGAVLDPRPDWLHPSPDRDDPTPDGEDPAPDRDDPTPDGEDPAGTQGGTAPDHGTTTLARFDRLHDAAATAFALAHDALVVEPAALEEERRVRAAFVADLHALAPPPVPDALDDDAGRPTPLPRARLRRLLALPAWLAERVDVTVDEACRAFGVSPAELEEDLGLLQDVVLPGLGTVTDTAIEPDGTIASLIEVTVPLRLDPLDRARVRSLLTAAESLEGGGDEGTHALIERLAQPAVAVASEDDPALVARLRQARDEGRVVTALHQRRDHDEPTTRTFTPTRLDWVDGQGYVGGWDHDRGAGRWFRLDRLADVRVGAPDPVVREVALDEIAYVPTGDEAELVLRCTHVGTWLLNRFPPTRRVDLDDGTVWAVVRTDVPEKVLDQVVVAAGEAEVVTPPALRDVVVERATTVA